MHEPGYLRTTRLAYDTVAADYAALLSTELEKKPVQRTMLDLFAELVLADGGGPVGDLGCGPGRVTGYLWHRGLDAFGVDLSPAMVEVARAAYPGLRFEVGSLDALDLPDGSYRMSPDRVTDQLARTGLDVHARLVRKPADDYETTQQAYLLARRTA